MLPASDPEAAAPVEAPEESVGIAPAAEATGEPAAAASAPAAAPLLPSFSGATVAPPTRDQYDTIEMPDLMARPLGVDLTETAGPEESTAPAAEEPAPAVAESGAAEETAAEADNAALPIDLIPPPVEEAIANPGEPGTAQPPEAQAAASAGEAAAAAGDAATGSAPAAEVTPAPTAEAAAESQPQLPLAGAAVANTEPLVEAAPGTTGPATNGASAAAPVTEIVDEPDAGPTNGSGVMASTDSEAPSAPETPEATAPAETAAPPDVAPVEAVEPGSVPLVSPAAAEALPSVVEAAATLEAPAEIPPFGLPETSAPGAPPEAAGEVPDRSTAQLEEAVSPEPAPPVPGEVFPALQPGAMVAGRYRIQQVLQTGPQRQTYLAQDLEGYRRCWACGSRENVQGEMYCTDCGAQLTGRTYRLLETPPEQPVVELPGPLVDNKIPGVALILDTPTDPETGRHYVVLEDVGGEPLSNWATTESADTPVTDERILNLMAQAVDKLQELHAAGIIGCDFTPEALQVLPDDRLVLADPSACRIAGTAGDDRAPAAEAQADVQRVGAALEQWYRGLRPEPETDVAGGETLGEILAHGREGGYHTAAELAEAVHELVARVLPPRDMQIISGRASDVGEQRQLNEDSLFALESVIMEATGATPLGLYVVADGMGGHDSGEVASALAVRTIAGRLSGLVQAHITGEPQDLTPQTSGDLLREAILEANQHIGQLSRQRNSDMGTTVTMALVVGNQATIANVGDSRTYVWRDGKLHQVTQDHSLVARLIAAGQLTPEESRHFDRRNEIYRALGDRRLTGDEVDVFHVTLRPFDALLLCSDGLWEMVRDEEIEQILLDTPDPAAAAHTLIAMANHNGGEDNISVIFAQTIDGNDK